MGKKLFIGLLILVAVLYVLVVSFGLFTVESESDQRQRKQNPEAGDNAAMRALDALLAPLAPRLVLNGLRCNGQPVAKIFRLTSSASKCTLQLCGACRMPNGKLDEEEHRRGELRIYDTGVQAYVFVDAPRDERPRDCHDQLPGSGLRLAVTYTPAAGGGDGPRVQCWLARDAAKPIALSVLEGGGTLRLECLSCDQDQTLRLRID